MSLAKQVTNCFRELQATSDRICDLGTFWYHSHLSTQYCDGLRGPMVIYDPEDPYLDMYDVDDESTVLTLADWYHVAAKLGDQFP